MEDWFGELKAMDLEANRREIQATVGQQDILGRSW
jgi:hypothetical protein